MKVFIKAKPGAKTESVRKIEGLFPASGGKIETVSQFIVSVREPPVGGRANRAIEKALAEYFHVPPSRVRIVSGHASREKVVEVEEAGR